MSNDKETRSWVYGRNGKHTTTTHKLQRIMDEAEHVIGITIARPDGFLTFTFDPAKDRRRPEEVTPDER